MSRPTALALRIAAEIERKGPITFHDFMQLALYDSDYGYYRTSRPKIGFAGDYYTSSNVHRVFGEVLADAFLDLFPGSDDAGNIVLVEIGAGTGRLATDILNGLKAQKPAAYERLRYVIVETSPAMRSLQRLALQEFSERVEWRDLEDLASKPVVGIIFSNEVIDALPVHRIRVKHGRLQELYVGPQPGGLADQEGLGGPTHPDTLSTADSTSMRRICDPGLEFSWGEPSTPRLSDYLESNNVILAEGQIAEIGLDAIDFFRKVLGAIGAGVLVTLDYGDTAEHLYDLSRPNGTIRAFSRHILADPEIDLAGEQDITASVNFTALVRCGNECGFEAVSYERQSNFLIRYGLIDRIVASPPISNGTDRELKERLAIKNLFVPGGTSDNFRVLVQRKERRTSAL